MRFFLIFVALMCGCVAQTDDPGFAESPFPDGKQDFSITNIELPGGDWQYMGCHKPVVVDLRKGWNRLTYWKTTLELHAFYTLPGRSERSDKFATISFSYEGAELARQNHDVIRDEGVFDNTVYLWSENRFRDQVEIQQQIDMENSKVTAVSEEDEYRITAEPLYFHVEEDHTPFVFRFNCRNTNNNS